MTEVRDRGELEHRLVELTKDLVLFPSTASRPDDRARCAAFLANHIESLDGVVIDEYSSGGYRSFVARARGDEHPDVLICAHLDVVEHADSRVYRPRVEDGRIVGPGAGDMKGPLAVAVEAFSTIHRQSPGVSLALAVTSDEEIGGHHGIRHLFERVGLRCGLAMIPDGGGLDTITIEEKGILHLTITTEAHGESSHASRPWLTVNPLEKLTRRLVRLQDAFEAYRDGSEDHWYPTCALTLLSTPNLTANRIPDRASALVDIRFPPPHSAHEMETRVREIVGTDMTVSRLIGAEPTHLSPAPRYVEITSAVTGQQARLTRESGGSDARFVSVYGTPVLMSRPVVGNLHAEDEWIDVGSMVTFYEIYERFLLERLVRPGA